MSAAALCQKNLWQQRSHDLMTPLHAGDSESIQVEMGFKVAAQHGHRLVPESLAYAPVGHVGRVSRNIAPFLFNYGDTLGILRALRDSFRIQLEIPDCLLWLLPARCEEILQKAGLPWLLL